MRMTTLCYIEDGSRYLMLHRTKKQQDQSHDKWIGVGGKFEEGESPEECMLREVYEETGLKLCSYKFRGIVTFLSDQWETEYMFLYTSNDYKGTMTECAEGELVWVEKAQMEDLTLWEGDRIFLHKMIAGEPFFSLKLVYQGELLKEAIEY